MPESLPVILIADDHTENLHHLRRRLDAAKIRNPVVTFSDGERLSSFLRATCVRGTREKSLQPAVLFLDLDLPRGASFEVLQVLQEHRELRSLHTVALTNQTDGPRVARAVQLGVSHFLGKRPTTATVAAHVKRARAD
jgi:CheY-like chemotaxis protein